MLYSFFLDEFSCSFSCKVFNEATLYKLEVGDQLAVTQEAKHDAVLNFFENVLGTAEGRDYTIDLSEIGVQQHDLSSLNAPFTEEVWVTIKDMPLGRMVLLAVFINHAGTS